MSTSEEFIEQFLRDAVPSVRAKATEGYRIWKSVDIKYEHLSLVPELLARLKQEFPESVVTVTRTRSCSAWINVIG